VRIGPLAAGEAWSLGSNGTVNRLNSQPASGRGNGIDRTIWRIPEGIGRNRRLVQERGGKYPPAKPGALWCEPLKAAMRGR